MNNAFKVKCDLLSDRLNILYKLLTELKEKIIINDLSNELDTQLNIGRQLISNFDWLEEIDIDGDTLTLIDRSKGKYYSYVIYTEKEYHTVGLGFMYKNQLISPHYEPEVQKIITNHSDLELEEISKLVDQIILNINQDIEYLRSNPEITAHKHYYGEYNKGIESQYIYDDISKIICDFKNK